MSLRPFPLAALIASLAAASANAATNVALGKPVLASSFEALQLDPARAVDGDPATRWSSAFGDPQWIRVDLGSPHALERVVLRWEVAYARAYTVDVSLDGESWTPAHATSSGDGEVDELAISGTARYVRVLGTQRATAWGYSLWEIEVHGTPPSPPAESANLALGRPATCSSVEAEGLECARAVDGDPATRWSSGASSAQQAIVVDLGARHDIRRVVLDWESYARGYSLEVSPDGRSWTDALTTVRANGGTETLAPLVASGRYLRLLLTTPGTPGGFSLREIEVYGELSGPWGPNVALQQAVVSSSDESPALDAAQAVDGDPATRWSSAFSVPQWLEIDLGARHELRRIVLRWETAHASYYRLEVSDDGVSWRTAYATIHSDGGLDDVGGLDVSGRFVRLAASVKATPWGISLWEMEVYGLPSP